MTVEVPVEALTRRLNDYYVSGGYTFYVIWAAASTSLTRTTSTLADVIQLEPLNTDGYSRQPITFSGFAYDSVNDRVASATSTVYFTTSVNAIQFDRVVLVESASATANKTVSSISTNTIGVNAHGLSNGDKVLFTNASNSFPSGITAGTVYYVVNAATDTFQIAASLGGSAISLGTSWSGVLVCRYANGSLVLWQLNDADGSGNRSITINPGQTKPIDVVVTSKSA